MTTNRKYLILIVLHLAVALPLAYALSIWADEASTLHTTQNGFFQTFNRVFADEKQAPLYFLLLSLWRNLDQSVFFARVFSIVCNLLAIKVFSDLARQFWEDKTAFFVAAIFALHPYLIWTSLEIRLYSLVILFSVVLLRLFFAAYFKDESLSANAEDSSGKTQIFFVAISILAVYTNYYAGFLLVGGFAALLVTRRWQAAKIYFLQMLAVGVAIAPLLWIIKQQLAVRSVGFHADKSLLEGLQLLWNHFLTFALPTELSPTGELSTISFFRLWLVRLAIAAVFIVLIKTKGKLLDDEIFALGTIWTVCNLFLLLVYFFLGIKYVETRHSVNSFAPLILLVALLVTKILPKKLWIYVVILQAIFYIYAIAALYPNLAKRGDWARVGAFIERNEKPNQPIIVFTNYDALCLPYYYQGVNQILPDENFFRWEAEDAPGSPGVYLKQTEFIVSAIPPDAPEIWLLTGETCQKAETKAACQPLENFVEANYTVIDEQEFYLETIRLLRKK